MKPYVGVVGLKSEGGVVNTFSLYHKYSFLSEGSTHSPAIFFDYGHDEITSDVQLQGLVDLMHFTADNLPSVELGLRYKHSKKDPQLSTKMLQIVLSELPPLSMFEFSHTYPAKDVVHECMKNYVWTKFVSHMEVSNIMSDALSSYFKKRFYSHYVFDTKGSGFSNPPYSSKKYFQSKNHSVGFAERLSKTDGLHIKELVELTGKNISLEARCLDDESIQRFISEASRQLL